MRTASAIASGRLSVGAVPGFASLATTSGTPAARSAATGGGACASVKLATGRRTAAMPAFASDAMPASSMCST